MNLTIDETGKQGILHLSGSLTIERIQEVKEYLQESLKLVNNLVIDHSEAEEFDLAYIQLLYSCYKTSQLMQKNFTIESSPGFSRTAEVLGFSEQNFYSYQGN
jgi:anti-anti-sigma regulatory factor